MEGLEGNWKDSIKAALQLARDSGLRITRQNPLSVNWSMASTFPDKSWRRFCKSRVLGCFWPWHSVLALEIARLSIKPGNKQTTSGPLQGKHRLADSNMSFANVQFPFYQVILYLLTFWNCESNTVRSSNVWPRLQILWWEFVWKEEFSRWLRCRLSFGPRPWWPISNSQGYFQLIIHLCHLNTYHLDGPFFDLQDDDYHAKNPKRRSLYDDVKSKSDFKIPTLQADFRPPLFATDGAEQRSPSIEPQ